MCEWAHTYTRTHAQTIQRRFGMLEFITLQSIVLWQRFNEIRHWKIQYRSTVWSTWILSLVYHLLCIHAFTRQILRACMRVHAFGSGFENQRISLFVTSVPWVGNRGSAAPPGGGLIVARACASLSCKHAMHITVSSYLLTHVL